MTSGISGSEVSRDRVGSPGVLDPAGMSACKVHLETPGVVDPMAKKGPRESRGPQAPLVPGVPRAQWGLLVAT